MTKNFENRKYKLIQEIIELKSEDDLTALERQVKSLHKKDDIRFLEAIKPIRKSITLEALIKEQGYQPIKKEEFFKKTSELEFEESLEELLSMLD